MTLDLLVASLVKPSGHGHQVHTLADPVDGCIQPDIVSDEGPGIANDIPQIDPDSPDMPDSVDLDSVDLDSIDLDSVDLDSIDLGADVTHGLPYLSGFFAVARAVGLAQAGELDIGNYLAMTAKRAGTVSVFAVAAAFVDPTFFSLAGLLGGLVFAANRRRQIEEATNRYLSEVKTLCDGAAEEVKEFEARLSTRSKRHVDDAVHSLSDQPRANQSALVQQAASVLLEGTNAHMSDIALVRRHLPFHTRDRKLGWGQTRSVRRQLKPDQSRCARAIDYRSAGYCSPLMTSCLDSAGAALTSIGRGLGNSWAGAVHATKPTARDGTGASHRNCRR
jgi:hypothetical protein